MSSYAFTRSRIFQWMGILFSLGIIAVGYWYYQSQASTTINKNLSESLATDLVGYWKLDDGTSGTTPTTATDSSPVANNGTLQGSATWTTGQINNAVNFSGSSQYISTSYSAKQTSTRTLTYAAWVAPNNTNGGGFLGALNGDDSTTRNSCTIDNSGTEANNPNVICILGIGGSPITVSTQFASPDSTWFHVAFTYDGTALRLYINGAIGGVTAQTGTIDTVADDGLMIGRKNSTGAYFTGKIDEVRMYTRALSADEVKALSNLNSPTADSGLRGYWTFDGEDVSGTTTYDRSGAGNNGTLTNGPVVARGKIGQAIAFDGNNDKVSLTDNAVFDVGGAGSWCNWFYSTANQSSRGMFSHNDSAGTGNYVMINGYLTTNSSILGGYVRIGTTAYTATSPAYATGYWNNQWHFVCTTFDKTLSSQRLKVYADGVLVGTHDAANGNVDAGTNPMIGNWVFGGGEQTSFQGSIDDVQMYNRALTAAEIKNLYDKGASDKTNTSAAQPQGTGNFDSGLVAYWRMDDGSGTSATDSSTNGHTGTLTNGPTWTTGQIGGAVDVDGSNDIIDVADVNTLDITNTITLSAWIKKDTSPAFGAYDTVVIKGDSGAPAINYFLGTYSLSGPAERVRFAYYAGGVTHSVHGSTTLSNGTWYHIAAVYNDTTNSFQMYVNGTPETLTTLSGDVANNSMVANAYDMDIGSSNGGSNFDGQIDELRIYSRAFSPEEIADLYRLVSPTGVDTGLKGYWSFNAHDMSGTTAYDRSGAGNTGTLTNSPTRALGKVGQGLSFDGTNDYVSITDVSALRAARPMSVSAWIKRDAISEADAIFWKRGSSNDGWWLQIESNNKITFTFGDVADISSTATVPDTNWHHIAVAVESGGGVTFYLDGVLAGTATIGTPFAGDGTLYLGATTDTSGALNGYTDLSMDEVRIYNRVLSAAEIKGQYDLGQSDKSNSSASQPQGTGRLDSGLAGYWRMDDGSGTSATDSSTNASTGTLTNGPTWGTGQISGAVDFDGTDDYISVADSSVLDITQTITLSAWVRGDSWANTENNFIIAKNDYDTVERRNYYLSVNTSGNLGFGFDDNGVAGSLFSTTTLSTGQWYFVAATYDRNNIKLYENGTLVRTAAETDAMTANTNLLSIGRAQRNNTSDYGEWDGLIDEARVYSRALSEDEVSQLYRLSVPTGTDTGLKGYWSFNGQDMNGTTAYDRSGVGNNGTLTSGPTKTMGKIGQGIRFDGSNDYVSIGDYAAYEMTGSKTIAFWFKSNVNPSDREFLVTKATNTPANDYEWEISIAGASSDRIFFALYQNDSFSAYISATGTTTIDTSGSTWYHVTAVYDSTVPGVYVYVNGVLEGSSTSTTGSLETGDTAPLLFGKRGDDGETEFGGVMDEVRIYNRALSAAEVAGLYNQSR